MGRQTILLRNSERQVYKRCRFRHWLEFEKKLKPKDTKPALRFGDLIHQSLEAYYKPGKKRGPHPTKTFKKLYRAQLEEAHSFGMRSEDEEWVSAEELGPAMLDHYIETYGSDDHIEVLTPEMPFQVDILHPKSGKYLVTIVGKLDIVYRDRRTGRIGIIDHKTAKTITTEHLALDEQAGTYWAFAPEFLRQKGLLPEDANIEHILYNFLRKAKKDERPRNQAGQYLNKNGSVSKVQPSPYFLRHKVYRDEADRENIVWRIRNEAWEMAQIRKGKLPIYKTPTRDCHWDCPFFAACQLHETGSDWAELLNLETQEWDPYSDHELYERKS